MTPSDQPDSSGAASDTASGGTTAARPAATDATAPATAPPAATHAEDATGTDAEHGTQDDSPTAGGTPASATASSTASTASGGPTAAPGTTDAGAEGADRDGRRGRPAVRGRFAPGRRGIIIGAAVAAGLVVLAGTADLVLAHTARSRIAGAAECRLEPIGSVSADLSGSLAGLRLLTGKVGDVHIRAKDVRRDGMNLSVAADLHQVTTKGTMSGGSATATIPYDELAKQLNRKAAGLLPRSDGHGGMVLTGTLAGIPLPVTVHTKITAGGDAVTVTPTDVDILGRDIPVSQLTGGQGGSALASKLGPHTVKAPQLPAGVTLTGAGTDADGLALDLALPASVASTGSKGCPG